MTSRLLEGDALVRLAELEDASIDACVTDPPYGISFMSAKWDHGVPGEPYWTEVLRVLKPGSHLVAFGGTRTYHRLTCAIEDAGFEVRDCLMWLHGQGFPKGKGCLKPGWEPIVLARKPAPAPWLNVDGCRIGIESTRRPMGRLMTSAGLTGGGYGAGQRLGREDRAGIGGSDAGRWPANVVLSHEDGCREVGTRRVKGANPIGPRPGQLGYGGSRKSRNPSFDYVDSDGTETVAAWECVPECAVRLLDDQSGHLNGRGNIGVTRQGKEGTNAYGDYGRGTGDAIHWHDKAGGGASRFFYCSKASTAERGAGNDHPTVKPLALMRWLVRLVTPPGGIVLDPFCGSGSTLLAADREGFEAVGIDSDPHAIEIARCRLADAVGPLFAAHEVSA